jgi:hypothetical protein
MSQCLGRLVCGSDGSVRNVAHLGLALARLYAGDAAGAIGPLERGLRLNPFDPQNFLWFRLLSLAYYFTGDAAKGVQAAIEALQVRPTWRPGVEALAICHLALGNVEEVRRRSDKLGQLTPPDSDVLEQLRIRNPHWAQKIADAQRPWAHLVDRFTPVEVQARRAVPRVCYVGAGAP